MIARRGFTLLELLVVVALMALLSGLGLSAAQQTLARARAQQCLNNLRQCGLAAALYSAENDGRLPQSDHQGPGQSWRYVLKPYLQDLSCFHSPLDPNKHRAYSYAINDFLTAHPFGAESLDFSRRLSIEAAGETLLLSVIQSGEQETDHFHFAEGGYGPSIFAGQVITALIQKTGHYLFVDGHAEARTWPEVETELTRPTSRFVRPDGQP